MGTRNSSGSAIVRRIDLPLSFIMFFDEKIGEIFPFLSMSLSPK